MAGERQVGTAEPQPRVIKARAGERFGLPLTDKDLNSAQEVIGSRRFIAGFQLQIEGVGNGSIEVFQDENFVSAEQKDLRRTPAGPIKVGIEIVNDRTRVDADTLPVAFSLHMYDQNDRQLQSTGTRLYHGNQSFEGQGDVIVNEETSPKKQTREGTFLDFDERATLDFRTWIDPKTGEPCIPYFSKDDVKKVEFEVDNYFLASDLAIQEHVQEKMPTAELLRRTAAYPALQSIVLETITEKEWEAYVVSVVE